MRFLSFILVDVLFNQISNYQSQNDGSDENESDILQTNGEVAFDCNVEELFLRADVGHDHLK